MGTQKAYFLFLLAVLVITLAAACIIGTTISEIYASPEQYDGKNVTVVGKVLEGWSIQIGSTEFSIYNVTDTTGSIVIVSHKVAPSDGSFVLVKGDVRTNGLVCAGRPVCVWQHDTE